MFNFYSRLRFNYNKAIELNPQNPDFYKNRAMIYRKVKKINLAIADEQKAKQLAESTKTIKPVTAP